MDFLICLAQDTFNCTKKELELPRIDMERGGFEKNKVEKKPKQQK